MAHMPRATKYGSIGAAASITKYQAVDRVFKLMDGTLQEGDDYGAVDPPTPALACATPARLIAVPLMRTLLCRQWAWPPGRLCTILLMDPWASRSGSRRRTSQMRVSACGHQQRSRGGGHSLPTWSVRTALSATTWLHSTMPLCPPPAMLKPFWVSTCLHASTAVRA
jgi:hypothetical protein